ncbi:MAG: tRNA pseudouridine(38-40) synthase TruA [Alistipes sp.]|nr:tRNA pseudouridine(38-40) synthase TruA [Alistipes sp.]
MRYFAELRYDGSAYCGWQRQNEAPSVQQTLERALSTLLRTEVATVGAGRTDTGVNAAYYVMHFDTDAPVADCAQLVYKLNLILPADIAIMSISEVSAEAHARFDAVAREYRYFISQSKNPFVRGSSWHYNAPLDIEAMNRAAASLLRYDDFTSFAKLNSNNKTNICRIVRAEWSANGDMLCFAIRADRFLRNMVRAIVGTLVDVGRGRYTPEEFENIVASRDLSRSSGGAPARGLFLWDVEYPETVFRRSAE